MNNRVLIVSCTVRGSVSCMIVYDLHNMCVYVDRIRIYLNMIVYDLSCVCTINSKINGTSKDVYAQF